MKFSKLLGIVLIIGLVLVFQNIDIFFESDDYQVDQTEFEIYEDEHYSDPYNVALYIFEFDKLPSNYLTKSEATDLGWVSQKGNLWEVAEGMSIGGDTFYNREGLLPSKEGRVWYECDVNYSGGYRNSERLVFSNDGLIYYTEDHYNSFEEIIKEQITR